MHHPPSIYNIPEQNKLLLWTADSVREKHSLGREKEEVKEGFGSSVRTENLADIFHLSMSRDTAHFIWEPISLPV